MDEATCALDGQTEAWHKENKVRHSFSPSGDLKVAPPQAKVRRGGDPVLRMALLRKGVLTSEEIDAVERELHSAGVAVHEPVHQS